MKLLSFRIGQYRVLRDIHISFDRKSREEILNPEQNYALDFLAGVNGTGKTTVLQVLVKLLSTLQTENYGFPIPVELTYSTTDPSGKDQTIKVTNLDLDDGRQRKQLVHSVNGGDEKAEKIRPENLPAQVVVYTTGSETAWQRELGSSERLPEDSIGTYNEAKEDQRYLTELPGHQPSELSDDEINNRDPNRNILFVYEERFPLVTLCGLLASIKDKLDAQKQNQILQPVLDSIELEDLSSFSLRLRQHRDLTPAVQAEIIAKLQTVADQIIQAGADRLLIFDIERQLAAFQQDPQTSILGLYATPIQLFQHLNLLYEHRPFYDAPVQKVNVFLRKKAPAQPGHPIEQAPQRTMLHLLDWLSDGERSFLGRMALFALFRADNLLIILDEPEVHFNDVWKREIVHMLDQIMQGCASHAIISTHSSIALTDVSKDDILVFRRLGNYVEGENAIRSPEIQTLGADPSDIMVQVFGTKFASGAHSVSYIRKKIAESESRQDLEDFQKTIAPGYWYYRVQLEIDQFGEQRLQ
jgi:predicted ATPase